MQNVSPENNDLRKFARSLFDIGVQAADPGLAVQRALSQRPLPKLEGGRHIVISVGKAACAMAQSAMTQIPGCDSVKAIVVTNYENANDVPGCQVFSAGHPTPDENGVKAGQAVLNLLMSSGPKDHILCLISGGGSALLPAPIPGLSLDDKIRTNELMLAGGLDIIQTNMVRQRLSLLKGGGLARFAAPSRVRTLAISDVVGDDPRAIASGPTTGVLGTTEQAVEALRIKGIWSKLPTSVQEILSIPNPRKKPNEPEPDYSIICSNRQSLDAIGEAAPDWSPQIVTSQLTGDVSRASHQISDFVKLSGDTQKLLIWGGETTVAVKGTGKGGRNQELALRLAALGNTIPGDWVFLCAGSDGRDGPTDAAGGIVDPDSLKRIQIAGYAPQNLLDNNDSYRGLQASGDLLQCGATGTNVADFVIFLRQ